MPLLHPARSALRRPSPQLYSVLQKRPLRPRLELESWCRLAALRMARAFAKLLEEAQTSSWVVRRDGPWLPRSGHR